MSGKNGHKENGDFAPNPYLLENEENFRYFEPFEMSETQRLRERLRHASDRNDLRIELAAKVIQQSELVEFLIRVYAEAGKDVSGMTTRLASLAGEARRLMADIDTHIDDSTSSMQEVIEELAGEHE